VEAVAEVTVAPHWSSKQALTILIGSAVAIGVVSEILVSVTEESVKVMGLSEFFVGLILVPIIGNAAEHSSAILMAMKNRMDLAINVVIGSGHLRDEGRRVELARGSVPASRVCDTRSSILFLLTE
jgi:Ca2+:H+ antiporter